MAAWDLIVEAPPDVEELYAQLAGPISRLFTRYSKKADKAQALSRTIIYHPTQTKQFADAVENHPLLGKYIHISLKHDKAFYSTPHKKIVLGCNLKNANLGSLLSSLYHELIHMEQHRRSGKDDWGYRKSHLNNVKKYFAANVEFEKQREQGKVNKMDFNRFAKIEKEKQKSYFEEPIEIQAIAGQQAAELKGLPDWKDKLRTGNFNRLSPYRRKSPYGVDISQKAKNRFFKNTYQALTRNETASAIVSVLLETRLSF